MIPVTARMPCPSLARFAATIPKGTEMRTAAESETATRKRCWAVYISSRTALRNAFARAGLGAGIHLDDGGSGNAALQLQESGGGLRGALGQLRPVKQHRMVARKVAQVILQDAQVVIADFGVGRIKIGEINRAILQPPIRQGMFQAGHILLRQLIAVAQARPAVPSFHEFVAKAKLQFRMLAEIGDPPDIKAGGERFA